MPDGAQYEELEKSKSNATDCLSATMLVKLTEFAML